MWVVSLPTGWRLCHWGSELQSWFASSLSTPVLLCVLCQCLAVITKVVTHLSEKVVGPVGWCNLTPNAKWNNSWFIVWRLRDSGLLRRALRCLSSPGPCSVAKLKEKFLLWRRSYKTLAIQELLRHVITSCWISHLKSSTSLERYTVGLPLYHVYKETPYWKHCFSSGSFGASYF